MDILIIDDQEWTISKLAQILREHDADVDYASTLEDGLTYMSDKRYDAIVTDYDIDELDGMRALQVFRGELIDESGNDWFDQAKSFHDLRRYDREIADILAATFSTIEEYREFVQQASQASFVLFSSHHFSSEDRPYGVLVAEKNNQDDDDFSSEIEIARWIGL